MKIDSTGIRRAGAIAMVVAASLNPLSVAPAREISAEDWLIEKVQWSAELGAAGTVRVRNSFGDLRVRPSEDGQVFVSAVVQRHVEDALRARVDSRRPDSEFEIEVVFAPGTAPTPSSEPESWQRRRVDLTLFLPLSPVLIAETEDGLIEIKGLESLVEARSDWGDIVLSTRGPAEAYSEHGNIEARFEATGWSSPTRLETLTGDITVLLSAHANVAIEMATQGLMGADFTLDVVHQVESPLKTGRARLGEASAELYLISDRGNLNLRRLGR